MPCCYDPRDYVLQLGRPSWACYGASVRRYGLQLFAYYFGRRGRVPGVLSGFCVYMGICTFNQLKAVCGPSALVMWPSVAFCQVGPAFVVWSRRVVWLLKGFCSAVGISSDGSIKAGLRAVWRLLVLCSRRRPV